MILALVFGCASPDPSGEWVGTHDFEDGEQVYSNAMNLDASGSGTGSLFFKAEVDSGGDEPDVMVLVSSFELAWSESGDGVQTEWTCTDPDCTSSFSADCVLVDETLECSGDPAFYEEELSLFRWKRPGS